MCSQYVALVILVLINVKTIANADYVIEDTFEGESYKIYGPPTIPKQFSATLETVAHQSDKSEDYPPWKNVIEIDYDAVSRKSRARYIQGFEEGRTFIRRYDMKKEVMIEHVKVLSKYECKRSYLGDKMPLPEFPEALNYQGLVFLKGTLCSYWTVSVQDLSLVHVYMNAKTGEPVRVTEEWIEDGNVTPLMTYEFKNFRNEAPSPDVFELTQGFTSKACDRHVGGFPYIHIFHTYLRL